MGGIADHMIAIRKPSGVDLDDRMHVARDQPDLDHQRTMVDLSGDRVSVHHQDGRAFRRPGDVAGPDHPADGRLLGLLADEGQRQVRKQRQLDAEGLADGLDADRHRRIGKHPFGEVGCIEERQPPALHRRRELGLKSRVSYRGRLIGRNVPEKPSA